MEPPGEGGAGEDRGVPRGGDRGGVGWDRVVPVYPGGG